MRLSRTNRGLVVDARLTTAIAGECARCLRPVVTPVKVRIDEEVLPTDRPRQRAARPARGGRRPRGAAPHRPPRARAAAARDRGDQPREPIAPAVRARLPGPVPRVRRAARARPRATTTPPIDPRLEALRAFRVDGPTIAGRLPARPQDPAVARSRAHRPTDQIDHQTASRASARLTVLEGATDRHGCAEAKGRSRAADGAPEPPRDHPADARSSVRTATSRSCRTGCARPAAGTTAARPSSPSRSAARPRARSPRNRFVSSSEDRAAVDSRRPAAASAIAVDAMGGDHGPAEVVPGAARLRPRQPRGHRHPRRRRGRRPIATRARCPPTRGSCTRPS